MAISAFVFSTIFGSAWGATRHADPGNYAELVRTLGPGDTLQLAPGRYVDGLRIRELHGQPGSPVVIEGPANGAPAVFEGRAGQDTVSIRNASHLIVRNLVLDGQGLEVDGVRVDRRSRAVHHITLENLLIVRHGPEQQTVGIAFGAPAAFVTIRNNVIVGAGTGMYLGGSDGAAPFVAGTIEGNVVVATTGYNIQIKHQAPRPTLPELPETPSRTVIRGNVFAKDQGSSTGPMARPNLLLGHWPREGPGDDDEYVVDQNVFYGNPTKTLMQAEGNLAIERNLFLNPVGDGVSIQPHNDVPKNVTVRDNFIATTGYALRIVGGDPRFAQIAERNEIVSPAPWMGMNIDPAQRAMAVGALTRWLGNDLSAPEVGTALRRALEIVCRPLSLEHAGMSAVQVVSSDDPACVALSRARTRAGQN